MAFNQVVPNNPFGPVLAPVPAGPQLIPIQVNGVSTAAIFAGLRAYIIPADNFRFVHGANANNNNFPLPDCIMHYWMTLPQAVGNDQDRAVASLILGHLSRHYDPLVRTFATQMRVEGVALATYDPAGNHVVGTPWGNMTFHVPANHQVAATNLGAAMMLLTQLQIGQLTSRAAAAFSIAAMMYIKTQSNSLNEDAHDLIRRMDTYGGSALPARSVITVIENLLAAVTDASIRLFFHDANALLVSEKIFEYRVLSARGVSDLSMAILTKKACPSFLAWTTCSDAMAQELAVIPTNPPEELLICQSDAYQKYWGANIVTGMTPLVNNYPLVPISEELRIFSYMVGVEMGSRTARGYIRGKRAADARPAFADICAGAFRAYVKRARFMAALRVGATASQKILALGANGSTLNEAISDVATELAIGGDRIAIQNARANVNANLNANYAAFDAALTALGV